MLFHQRGLIGPGHNFWPLIFPYGMSKQNRHLEHQWALDQMFEGPGSKTKINNVNLKVSATEVTCPIITLKSHKDPGQLMEMVLIPAQRHLVGHLHVSHYLVDLQGLLTNQTRGT